MHLTTDKKRLLKLLERCKGVVDTRAPVPVLCNVLVSTTADGLRLSAQSLMQSVTGIVEADVHKHGALLVDAARLTDRVKSMPDGELQLKSKDNELTICGVKNSRKFKLATIPADEYPKFPAPDESSKSFTIPSSILATLIDSTVSAVSPDETRVALSSLLLEFTPDRIRAVSTDGHRAHIADARFDGAARSSMLLPYRSIQQLKQIVGGKETSVELRELGSMAFFDVDSVRFGLRLVDAQFPPYERVIPKSHEGSATVNRMALIASVQAIGNSVAKHKGAKFTIGSDLVQIEASGFDEGEATDTVSAETIGDGVFGCSPKYMLDALHATPGETVRVSFGGELDPIVVEPAVVSDGFEVKCVIMPMRI